MPDPGMFDHDPDFREPARFTLDRATIRHTVATPRADNSAYLTAMREFRERYEQAERDMGGPVVISDLIFRRVP